MLHTIEGSETTDWPYHFEELPCWNKQRDSFSFDTFYEVENRDVLCCVFSIREVRMGWYKGYLAILKDKQAPKLVLYLADNFLFSTSVFKDENSILYFQGHYYDKVRNILQDIIVVTDVINEKIAYILPQKLAKDKYYKNMEDYMDYQVGQNPALDHLLWFKFEDTDLFIKDVQCAIKPQ